MKVSFVTTCLNEQDHIKDLLDSLVAQTKKPDEIIIVDAGSKDKTIDIIKSFIKTSPIPTKLIVKKNIFRSVGRNLGVKKTKHPIIAISDVGNTLDKNWIKLITKPFKDKKVDSVGGYYKAVTSNTFEECIVPFVATMPDKLDSKTFLPSSRSVAFTKKAFKKVGGYPEHLNTCEDLIFASKLKQMTNLVIEPKVIANWRQVETLLKFFNMIANHTTGDVKGQYLPHLKRIIKTHLKYLVFTLIPPLFLFYLAWPVIKFYKYIKKPLAFIYLPTLQVTTDLAIIFGSIRGAITKSLL